MTEYQKFVRSLFFPSLLIIILWSIKGSELILGVSFTRLGIHPRELDGIVGIITAPLIHGDMNHLIDNSIPLFLLMLALFYFYYPIAYRVVILGWLISGFWIWVGARPYAWHIGASGLIYCFASFIFFSGILKKNPRLLAISLLVIFLYGGMVWGILPVNTMISWESHLYGGIAGLVLAFYYRNLGSKETSSEEDEDEEVPPELAGWQDYSEEEDSQL